MFLPPCSTIITSSSENTGSRPFLLRRLQEPPLAGLEVGRGERLTRRAHVDAFAAADLEAGDGGSEERRRRTWPGSVLLGARGGLIVEQVGKTSRRGLDTNVIGRPEPAEPFLTIPIRWIVALRLTDNTYGNATVIGSATSTRNLREDRHEATLINWPRACLARAGGQAPPAFARTGRRSGALSCTGLLVPERRRGFS